MDEQAVLNLVNLLPNFAIGLLMLYWQRQTIDRLLDTQSKLIDRLLQYVDSDKEAFRAVGLTTARERVIPSEPHPDGRSK